MNILKVNNLTKKFSQGYNKKSILALDNISFELKKGSVLGVIGPNGSGKTTLFKTILNFIKPNKGAIELFSGEFSPSEIKQKIGFLNEKIQFYSC